MTPSQLGPIQRRLLAEDLVRLRRPDEQRRYAACQRQGRIDPNPHQIDAVVFALRRIPEGGCILADEVGLGKTIEAGLIISQLMAEGMRRVLLIVPKSLLGQWQTELYTLFGIEAREGRLDPEAFAGTGVFLTHRELAGGLKGASVLKAADPFDLVVVDEAHEVFSAVYKRYDKDGVYDEDSKHAQTAGRVREVVKRGGSPVLLLTATPIQNSLAELWGLVQYVEPTGTLLGRLPTFREVFCDTGDRSVLPDQAPELKRRLQTVLQRTLRRQAQEFLEVPFVERRSRVFEYSMSPEEKGLYDDVTAWLMREDLYAFRGSQRHLLLIGFHRRMASSLEALSVSLRRVAQRLRERLANRGYTVSDDGAQLLREISDDFEGHLEAESKDDIKDDNGLESGSGEDREPVPETDERLRVELEVVERFAARATALSHDSKARRLLDALRIIRERGEQGSGTGKAVIFTESLTTQNYLRKLLLEHGHTADDVTLFRGANETPDAERALARWETEVGQAIPGSHRPSREVAIRLALVYEFAQRSKVFISTEAGAKGLNLQFCDTVINYDLPWNPQRIEQRIGRVHRYGQKRGVTVVSFLAAGNEAQRLTLEILTQKLDLFGKVLDASDAILYEPAHAAPESLVASVSVDFEKELRSIYSRARSVDDVTDDLRHLRSTMEERRRAFNEEQDRASGLVESRLDDAVRHVFAKYRSELPAELAGLDRDVDAIMKAFLDGSGTQHQRVQLSGRVEYRIKPSASLPEGYREGFVAIIGDSRDLGEGEVLHLGHPVVQAAIEDARRATGNPFHVMFGPINGSARDDLRQLVGRRGRLVVTKTSYRGIEPVDNLLITAIMEDSEDSLPSPLVDTLLQLPVRDSHPTVDAEGWWHLQEAVDEAVFADQAAVSSLEQTRFQQMLRQLDHYLADQVLIMRRKRAALDARLEDLEKKREKALSPQNGQDATRRIERLNKEAREIDRQIERLEEGGDEEYKGWRDRLFARRFQKPDIVRVLDVHFEVASGDSGC
jgi:adenine-specific DNA-methyltransferase